MSSGGSPSTNTTSSAPSYPGVAKSGPPSTAGPHGLVPRQPAAPSNSYASYGGQRPPMYSGKTSNIQYDTEKKLFYRTY